MLKVEKVNKERDEMKKHKADLEQRITEVRQDASVINIYDILQVKTTLKNQGGEGEDPDSRMDSERADRSHKKGGKGKVLDLNL